LFIYFDTLKAKCGHRKDKIHPPLYDVVASKKETAVSKEETAAPKKETAVPKKEVPEKRALKPEVPDLTATNLKEERKKRKKEKKLAKRETTPTLPSSPALPSTPTLPSTLPSTSALPLTPTLPLVLSRPNSIKDLFVGQEISDGRVVRLREGLGAFVQLSPTLTGLLHISNMSQRFDFYLLFIYL
jgi:hypothetical protein